MLLYTQPNMHTTLSAQQRQPDSMQLSLHTFGATRHWHTAATAALQERVAVGEPVKFAAPLRVGVSHGCSHMNSTLLWLGSRLPQWLTLLLVRLAAACPSSSASWPAQTTEYNTQSLQLWRDHCMLSLPIAVHALSAHAYG